jgi:FkbM family methyltransferase
LRLHSFQYALTFRQLVKLMIVKLFRLSGRDVIIYDVLNYINNQGMKLNKLSPKTFEISEEELGLNKYILRKQTSDLVAFNQVIIHSEYSMLVEFVEKYYQIEKIKYVVDAGANIGLTSLYLSTRFCNAKFLAIEPAPENFSALKSNVLHNKRTQIIPLHNALWFERSSMVISNSFRDGQDWSIQVLASSSESGHIEALPISEILKLGGFEFIDILKMDIEGSEKKLFDSKEFLDQLLKVKFIAIELHEEVVDKIEVINQLQDMGFKLRYRGETIFGVNLKAINS